MKTTITIEYPEDKWNLVQNLLCALEEVCDKMERVTDNVEVRK